MSTPYTISVSDDVLTDLRDRLARTRLPAPLPGASWSRGVDLGTLRTVLDHWRDGYDWRAQERRLNGFPQFLAEIDGVDIHFFHIRGTGPDPTPLLLVHGWPGSPVEFLGLVDALTDPAAHGAPEAPSFDVVIPSIPGYGFGGKPAEEGWNTDRVADAFDHLMTEELGYSAYGAQGGDWGGLIATALGVRHPEHVVGLHLNLALVMPPADADPADVAQWGAAAQEFQKWEGAYGSVQSSRPMSLAVGQTDSPAGLAAWILEKFHAWSDLGAKSVLDAYSLDDLITNLMFYWAPNSAASAASFYYENFGLADPDLVNPVTVPVAFARFPAEMATIALAPDSWYQARFDIRQLTHFEHGGHFAALEQPGALVADVRRFFAHLTR
ncbi:epoxide hydrolase family protein [Streptomyces cavernae]|uniref:epoxide hydrolase family protein n=1 Tax=Streptomyces cavernae TaxID=2259034 RepID=UPI000FEB7DC0|nr:epoxide hydrolase family protein [Streptomyces cavernae]